MNTVPSAPGGHWGAPDTKATPATWQLFMRGFLPLLAILIAGAIALYQFRITELDRALDETANSYLDLVQAGFLGELQRPIEDAHLLAATIRPVTDADLESESTARILRALSDTRSHYYQVRLIDRGGIERLGVRRESDRTRLLTLDELHDVRFGEDFTQLRQLAGAEVYFSPFDLSTDQGRIDEPFRPVARVTAPLTAPAGERMGAVVLYYDVSRLLESLARSNTIGFVQLLTTDGYWVKARDASLQWGYVLAERRRALFSRIYPREWQAISTNGRGDIVTATGKFWFRSIQLAGASAGSGTHSVPQWKLLLHVPVERLQARNLKLAGAIGLSMLAVAIIAATFYWRLARAAGARD